MKTSKPGKPRSGGVPSWQKGCATTLEMDTLPTPPESGRELSPRERAQHPGMTQTSPRNPRARPLGQPGGMFKPQNLLNTIAALLDAAAVERDPQTAHYLKYGAVALRFIAGLPVWKREAVRPLVAPQEPLEPSRGSTLPAQNWRGLRQGNVRDER